MYMPGMMSISKLRGQLFCFGLMPGLGADFRTLLKRMELWSAPGWRQGDHEPKVLLSKVDASPGYTRFCLKKLQQHKKRVGLGLPIISKWGLECRQRQCTGFACPRP